MSSSLTAVPNNRELLLEQPNNNTNRSNYHHNPDGLVWRERRPSDIPSDYHNQQTERYINNRRLGMHSVVVGQANTPKPLFGTPVESPPKSTPVNKYGIPEDFSGENPLLQLTYYIQPMRWDLYEDVNRLLDQYEQQNNARYATKASLKERYQYVRDETSLPLHTDSRWKQVAPLTSDENQFFIRKYIERSKGMFDIEGYHDLSAEERKLIDEQRDRLFKAFGVSPQNFPLN